MAAARCKRPTIKARLLASAGFTGTHTGEGRYEQEIRTADSAAEQSETALNDQQAGSLTE